jgi:hypothetical protein
MTGLFLPKCTSLRRKSQAREGRTPLDAIVYPDLPEWLIVGVAVVVCAAILSVYLRRYLNRRVDGTW